MKALRVLLPFLMLALLGCSSQGEKDAQPQPPPETEAQAPASLPAGAYSFSARSAASVLVLHPGEETKIEVTIKNTSHSDWPGDALAKTSTPLCASYHLRSTNGELIQWDGARTIIADRIPAGTEKAISLDFLGPATPGDYILEIDLLQENVFWFSRMEPSHKLLDLHIQVKAG